MTENSEICRINADGTTTYHWDNIETAAQRWQPGCDDISVYVSKLLLPLRPNLEWVGLTADDLREPKNGKNWRVEWWNESCRMMLPSDMRIDAFQSYNNGTLQFTIKRNPQAIEAKLKEKNS